MIELVYMSRAHIQLTSDELTQILHQAREYNARKGITGLLLYDGQGSFIQALEGPEHNVDALFEKIKQDPRHARVTLLWRHAILQRAFGDWKMGFRNAQDMPPGQGFSDFMNEPVGEGFSVSNPNFSLDLLKFFRANYA